GGHTMEMIQLLRTLDWKVYPRRMYVVADSDTMSLEKAKELEHSKLINSGSRELGNYNIIQIPRSRKVKQSWITTPFTTLLSFVYCIRVVLSFNPTLILCNGPGTCVPICMAAYIQRFRSTDAPYLMYIESFARVRSLSLSGKLLYRFVDRFVVQWPQLRQKYKIAQYEGVLV
ncbi:oligosaccharide biosynthesis protein Alg14-like protein, partial [Paraphysoderma sedebokerense]